jgi:hypothetical protein
MGVELEIENTSQEAGDMRGFRTERDGSLRNNGWEFITLPMYYNNLSERLDKFFAANKFNETNYSERCSVHVHANCRDLTLDQVSAIVLIYQAVEKLLFNFIGNDRDKNIFCVPLSETTITYRFVERLSEGNWNVFRDWNKYTALNLMPLCNVDQGTIEFRHMAGTCDVEFIKAWLRIISRIFAAVRETTLDEWKERLVNLNSNSRYHGLLLDVFKEEATYLLTPGYESLLEEGVLLLKYSLMGRDKPRAKTVTRINDADAVAELLFNNNNITAANPMPVNSTFDYQVAIARIRGLERRPRGMPAQWFIEDTPANPAPPNEERSF